MEKCFTGTNMGPQLVDATAMECVFRHNVDQAVALGANGKNPFPTYDMDVIAKINSLSLRHGLASPFSDWTHPQAGDPLVAMGCALLREDSEAYQAFADVCGLDDGILEGWGKASDSEYLTRGTGVPIRTGPVTTEEERRLYRCMSVKYRASWSKWDDVDFSGLAIEWNKLILQAFLADSDSFYYDNQKYDIDRFTLKDAMRGAGDFTEIAKSTYEALSTCAAKGATRREREEFDSLVRETTKDQTKDGPDAAIPEPTPKREKTHLGELSTAVALAIPMEIPSAQAWRTGPVPSSPIGPLLEARKGCPSCGSATRHSRDCDAQRAFSGQSKSDVRNFKRRARRRALAATEGQTAPVRIGAQFGARHLRRARAPCSECGSPTMHKATCGAHKRALAEAGGDKKVAKARARKQRNEGRTGAGITAAALAAALASIASSKPADSDHSEGSSKKSKSPGERKRPGTRFSREAALSVLPRGSRLEWVLSNGSCFNYACMATEQYDDEGLRQAIDRSSRESICKHVEDVMNGRDEEKKLMYAAQMALAVNEHRAGGRHQPFPIDDPSSMLSAVHEWFQLINTDLWIGHFEQSILGVPFVARWNEISGDVTITAIEAQTNEPSLLSISQFRALHPDVTHVPLFNDRDHYWRLILVICCNAQSSLCCIA